MTISLAAGDATNLALRLLKVVEEVLGKQAKARQHRVKQDAARVHAQSLGCRNADCRHKVSLSDIASWRWGTAVQGGDNPTQTPKATGQRGDRPIGQSGSAIVFG